MIDPNAARELIAALLGSLQMVRIYEMAKELIKRLKGKGK